jgi:broad specificity phosphatase PhoE
VRRTYLFVRHGRAVYQEPQFRFEDHPKGTDWPLAARGHLQARAVAKPLLAAGVERVVSSDLERAKQTASHIATRGALPYEHRWPELNELDPARLRRGRRPKRPEWWHGLRLAGAMRGRLRGAEPTSFDVHEIERRVRDVLERLDDLDEQRVAVVGHGWWILMAGMIVPGSMRARWIDNCSITRIDADGAGGYRLVAFASPNVGSRAA